MTEMEIEGPIGGEPHIGVRVRLIAGSATSADKLPAEAFIASMSKDAPLELLSERLCTAVGSPPDSVILMYEGSTLEPSKTLEDNSVNLPGPAARRRGAKVEISFDIRWEVIANAKKQAEAEELRKRQEREAEEKKQEAIRREAERKAEEEQKRQSQAKDEISFDQFIERHIGMSQEAREKFLAQGSEKVQQWEESGGVPLQMHYIEPVAEEVRLALESLMHKNGCADVKVIRAFRNENETLKRRYLLARERLQGAREGIKPHKVSTQDLGPGRTPLDFLGPYDPSINEYPLWHGTPRAIGAGGICSSGFDIAYAGTRGLAWGHGFYFADKVSTSAGYSGSFTASREYPNCYAMLLCRVLCGNLKHLSNSPSEEDKERLTAECLGPGGVFGAKSAFHCLCGASWAYVCAHRDQVYPLYVIIYQHGGRR